MNEPSYNWNDRTRDSKAAGMAACEFYVVFSEPVKGRRAVLDLLPVHLEHQRKLEADGVIVAAGPLSDEKGEAWTGIGMIILRAESLEDAHRIAATDPMHKEGVRKPRILPWLMNEMSLTIRYSFLNKKISLA